MDFSFSDEENDFRSSVRDWVNAKYPKAKCNELERHEDHDGSNFPNEYWKDLVEAGYLGIGISEEFGGQGGGATIQAILMEELAVNLAGLTWVWGISSFCAKSIEKFGSKAVREEFVPAMVRGEKKVAITITEPGGGTDLLGAMVTRAKPTEGGFLINGAKIWSTMAHVCDYLMVLATTSDHEKSSRGKTLFLVPTDQAGVIATPIPKLGMRCVASCEVRLRQRLRARRLRDRRGGQGLVPHPHHAQQRAHPGRGARHGGAARGDGGRDHLRQGPQSVRPSDRQLPDHPALDRRHGDEAGPGGASDLQGGVAVRQRQGRRGQSSTAKAVAAEYATWAADRGLQILGGMGYAAEFDMQRYWRDVRLYQIGPVTNEMVRNIVAESLGLERSF